MLTIILMQLIQEGYDVYFEPHVANPEQYVGLRLGKNGVCQLGNISKGNFQVYIADMLREMRIKLDLEIKVRKDLGL